MAPELQRIVFTEVTAAIYVKTKIKGKREVKRHNTKGRQGKDRISLWGEIIAMIEDKGLAVRAPSIRSSRPVRVLESLLITGT
jgi:hypothetical protein